MQSAAPQAGHARALLHLDLVHREADGDGGDHHPQSGDLSSQTGHFSLDVDSFLKNDPSFYEDTLSRLEGDLYLLLGPEFDLLVSLIQEVMLIEDGHCLLFVCLLGITLTIIM